MESNRNRKGKMSKLEENLFHVELAIGDAQWELEGTEGFNDLKDSLQIAREYLEEVKRELHENNERDTARYIA